MTQAFAWVCSPRLPMFETEVHMAQSSYSSEEPISGWAAGLALFASVIMMMTGVFQAVVGVAALVEDEFYVLTPSYAYQVDVTTWGWVHLLLGIVIALAGWGVVAGQAWGRVVGIILAALSAVANFFFIPYYPVWSLLIIALDVFVIWALSVYGRTSTGV